MATHGESKEDSLYPSAGRDGQRVVRQQGVRREQMEPCPPAGETHALWRTGLWDDIGGYSDSCSSGFLS